MTSKQNFETDLCTDHRRPFADLAALNRRFISLVIESCAANCAPIGGLDKPLCRKLAGLDSQQVERLASCPYALFELHFTADDFWVVDLVVPRKHDPRLEAFFLTALCFGRTLATRQRELFFLFFGKSADAASRLARHNLAALADVAACRAGLLSARLPRHPRFWPDLIDFVSEGSVAQYRAATAVGMQLAASEPAAGESGLR